MKKATFFRDTSSEKTIKKSEKDLTAMISAAKIRQTDRQTDRISLSFWRFHILIITFSAPLIQKQFWAAVRCFYGLI